MACWKIHHQSIAEAMDCPMIHVAEISGLDYWMVSITLWYTNITMEISPCLVGKFTVSMAMSIAMLVYQRAPSLNIIDIS